MVRMSVTFYDFGVSRVVQVSSPSLYRRLLLDLEVITSRNAKLSSMYICLPTILGISWIIRKEQLIGCFGLNWEGQPARVK
jgi:hypothetical protein